MRCSHCHDTVKLVLPDGYCWSCYTATEIKFKLEPLPEFERFKSEPLDKENNSK